MNLSELQASSPPFLVCPKGFKPPMLGDFEKSGSPRIGGWGANSYRYSATPNWNVNVEFHHCYLEPTVLAHIAHETVNPDRVELPLLLDGVDPLVYQIGQALKADLEIDGIGHRFYADSLTTALAAHLLLHYSTRKHKLHVYEDRLPKDKLKQAIDYMNANLGENLSLAEMATILHISQYHFCRLFKQSTGTSPHAYLMQQRLDRAKQLLKQPELTETHIAQECGFANQSHLAKYFRRYTGVSPTKFRKL